MRIGHRGSRRELASIRLVSSPLEECLDRPEGAGLSDGVPPSSPRPSALRSSVNVVFVCEGVARLRPPLGFQRIFKLYFVRNELKLKPFWLIISRCVLLSFVLCFLCTTCGKPPDHSSPPAEVWPRVGATHPKPSATGRVQRVSQGRWRQQQRMMNRETAQCTVARLEKALEAMEDVQGLPWRPKPSRRRSNHHWTSRSVPPDPFRIWWGSQWEGPEGVGPEVMTAFGQTAFGQNLCFGVLAFLGQIFVFGCVPHVWVNFRGVCVRVQHFSGRSQHFFRRVQHFFGRVFHFCPPLPPFSPFSPDPFAGPPSA